MGQLQFPPLAAVEAQDAGWQAHEEGWQQSEEGWNHGSGFLASCIKKKKDEEFEEPKGRRKYRKTREFDEAVPTGATHSKMSRWKKNNRFAALEVQGEDEDKDGPTENSNSTQNKEECTRKLPNGRASRVQVILIEKVRFPFARRQISEFRES